MQRAVARADLHSPASSPEPEPDQAALERLKGSIAFDFVSTQDLAALPDHLEDQAEDLDFRLFATEPAAKDQRASEAQKIRLRSPTPQTGEPGFLQPDRPSSYYFVNSADSRRKEEFQQAALSGAQVSSLSKRPWPGSAYPWKVLHLPRSSVKRSVLAMSGHANSDLFTKLGEMVSDESTKRKRPGKKARIKVRVKLAAQAARSEKARAGIEAKGRAEREKRAKKNRDKKLKKRAKDKAKKSQVQRMGGEGEGIRSDEDGSEGVN